MTQDMEDRSASPSLIDRAVLAVRTYRRRGAAHMDLYLWTFWVVSGRYPR